MSHEANRLLARKCVTGSWLQEGLGERDWFLAISVWDCLVDVRGMRVAIEVVYAVDLI